MRPVLEDLELGTVHSGRQVIWRLDNGARTYLPRMAGALTAITPVPSDAACYILTQADNTIRMVRPPPLHMLLPLPSWPHMFCFLMIAS